MLNKGDYMLHSILTDSFTSVSELKKNPMGVIAKANGAAIAVLNHNQPVFYCIPAESYELLMDQLEDIELSKIIMERKDSDEIEMSINDL
jgi:antitoxin StbD